MSLAENLLNSLDATSYKNMRTAGSVEEEHIIVGKDRVITVPNALKTIAVKGDKDVETATIDCIRYWDENDLSTFAIYLNYILPNGDEGTYIPKTITKSDDFFSFDWEIGSEFTYAQGKLTFWIVTKLTDDNGELVKQWSSFQNSDCSIAQGGDKIYVPEKQTDQDVISQAISISRASAETAEKQAILAIEAANKAALDASQAAEEEVSRIIGELGVVQELGDSPNSVVSQLKVTKEFNKTNAKVNRDSKRITNIEQGLTPDSFETDDSVAYQKDVPANALPYAEIAKIGGMTYKDGDTLRSAKVTEVKSVGVNLLNIPQTFVKDSIYYGYDLFTGEVGSSTAVPQEKVKTLPYLKPGEYYFSYSMDAAIQDIYVMQVNDDGSIGVTYIKWNGKFTVPQDTRITLKVYTNEVVTINNIMLKAGSTAEPYTPYQEHTLPILPEEVRPANGINENVYDYIEWAEDGSVKQGVLCGVADLGTLAWQVESNYAYSFSLNPAAKSGGDLLYTNLPTGIRMSGIDTAQAIVVAFDEGSYDAASFKAAMSGVMLVYELAEPIVTDISDLITADNLIGVEGGGVITFENEYSYDVPSEVEYQLEV